MTRSQKAFTCSWLLVCVCCLAWVSRVAAQQAPATQPPAAPEQPAADAPPAKDPVLRFNFRFQRWSDVLEWFAGQANLSLVLDAPPPGTFNYSDNRDYSVPEALDLLNGVLLTKGYSLVRSERMLLLVNLADGIPESLVPRITLAELDKRGKFEIVSMLFPVENRVVDDVVKEIAPLLGTRGKSMPLPKTKQVLVTDTAGVMRAIHAVIESMPQPKEPQPETPEKPELVVYPLKSADPDAAVKVLEALLPTARIVRDPKANQISAYATPSQQAAVKRVLEQMQTTEGPADQQARFEVYLLEDVDAKTALLTLQPLVPGARISIDPTSKKLAAWGTPVEHEVLKKAVAQLGQGGGAPDDRQIEVYRLAKADPASTIVMLQSIVPRAKLAVDAPTRSIVALASLADQKAIQATLEQIEPQKRAANGPEVRFYPFEQTPPANLVTVLQSLVPKAQVTVDAATKRLTVVATPADHEVVKETFEQFTSSKPGDEKRELVLYPVTAAQRKRFQLVLTDLTTEFPTVKVLTDAEPGELAVWAKPSEHAVIADIVEKLKQQAPAEESYRLVAYAIKSADPASILSVLQTLFPTTKLVLDAKSKRLVAWTRPAEQETIKSLVDQMDSDVPAESKNQLMVYPVFGFDPTAAIATLKLLAPDATLTSDVKANTIMAWARKSDQALIMAALERLQPGSDEANRPRIVVYSVGTADPVTLSPMITSLVPTARVAANVKNGTLSVWATPKEHETIRGAIDEMAAARPDSQAGKVVVYTLKETSAASIVSALQTAVPEARLGVGQNTRKLVAWARPNDHETIRKALEDLDSEDAERSQGELKLYAVANADAASLLATLQSLFGTRRELRLSLDAKNNKIVAMATPAQHEAIRGVIDEIERGSKLEAGTALEVHPLGSADSEVVMQVLTNLVTKQSRALLSVDAKARQLIAVAPEAQQATIRTTIEQLQSAPRTFEVFQLEIIDPRIAEAAINKVFADTAGGTKGGAAPSIETDPITQRLFVRAREDQVAQIRELLIKMGEANLATAREGTIRVIPFTGDSAQALAEIQRVWPQLSKHPLKVLRPGELPGRLRRKPSEGRTEEEKKSNLPDRSSQPVAPPVPPAAAPQGDQQTQRGLHRQVVQVKTADVVGADEAPPAAAADEPKKPEPAADAGEPEPIVVAPGDDKITIMSDDPEAMEQFEALLRALSPPGGAGGREVMVYLLRSANSTSVAELLNRIFRRSGFDFREGSSAVIEADQRLNAIVVVASHKDRAAIERVIKVLDSEDVPESLVANRPTLIPVKNTSASRIEFVIKEVYKTQLTSGGVRQQIPIPGGATREVAAVIQQINTAASGPLMTLGVDDTTNSIVVMAPGPLVKEVSVLVSELDEAALKDTSRGVKIVKLKSTSAIRVKEILDAVLKDAVRRRGSRP